MFDSCVTMAGNNNHVDLFLVRRLNNLPEWLACPHKRAGGDPFYLPAEPTQLFFTVFSKLILKIGNTHLAKSKICGVDCRFDNVQQDKLCAKVSCKPFSVV